MKNVKVPSIICIGSFMALAACAPFQALDAQGEGTNPQPTNQVQQVLGVTDDRNPTVSIPVEDVVQAPTITLKNTGNSTVSISGVYTERDGEFISDFFDFSTGASYKHAAVPTYQITSNCYFVFEMNGETIVDAFKVVSEEDASTFASIEKYITFQPSEYMALSGLNLNQTLEKFAFEVCNQAGSLEDWASLTAQEFDIRFKEVRNPNN